ncbi:MAG: asparagine synthase (glutamine-hydrolyzing) [Chitinophagales bacterium]
MCGIAGVITFKESENYLKNNLDKAINVLNKRGPDFQSSLKVNDNVLFAHARLSIIDVSDAAHQPMQSSCGRYTLVFNGEIFNYKALKKELLNFGEKFETNSDTEVLLKTYIRHKEKCLDKLNGFFAFAIYDSIEKNTFVARDRMGIKPLLFRKTEAAFLFASEMKAIMAFGIPKKIDYNSVHEYFRYNYIPSPNSIFEDVKKLEPGHFLKIEDDGSCEIKQYYKIPNEEMNSKKYHFNNYELAQETLRNELEKSVQLRLVSDVPLGTFLSGGIDSSVITALAAKHKPNLNTFSVGFSDNAYFDETQYANLVAKMHKTNHTVFSLSNKDLYNNLNEILEYIDEPFADSSAIPVYILSKKTREKVTVSLSGDGADEMFGGYNKHFADWKIRQNGLSNKIVTSLNPVWKTLPKSRNGKFSNIIRQLNRFAEGSKLSDADRYLQWCSISSTNYCKTLLKNKSEKSIIDNRNKKVKSIFTQNGDLNETLYADMHQVLVNDMLTKVDSMSMANSLEVRTPFLDHNLVNFAFQLPPKFKVNKSGRKMILKDAFRKDLPEELYVRNKMGFEIPLLEWFRTDLNALIFDDLLEEKFIISQGVFNFEVIKALKSKLFSNNPEDVHAQIWALIVFQTWWKKYMN